MNDRPDTESEDMAIPPEGETDDDAQIPADNGDEAADETTDESAREHDVSGMSREEIARIISRAKERDKFYDRFLRARAELENYRKRVPRDIAAARDIAVMDLARLILPVLDNFDRALGSADDHKKFKAFHKGIAMIEQQLYKALEDGGIKRIEALGAVFDPERHESVMMEASGKKPEGTILEELEKGYSLRGKVIRPAKVKISGKPPGSN